ncbi:MAG: ATP-binding protein, partial [Planctomycetota bacterium JB042]
LFFTGGPTNPFSVFYMVNIVLAAVVLPPLWAGGVTLLALASFTTLFFAHVPLPELVDMGYRPPANDAAPTMPGERMSLYLKGLLVASVMAATTVAVFVTRLTAERNALEESLEGVRSRKARSERLEALGTLAAGAAHELASPLSTIAVIAKDLEIALARALPDDEAAEDARLIRQEVSRCRQILDQMAADAGQSAADNVVVGTVDELIDATLQNLRRRDHVEIAVRPETRHRPLRLPRRALSLALRQIVKNALDASKDRGPIRLEVSETNDELLVVVVDRGEGMTRETLERATDPFFTTKEPGEGMGLGLFLSQSVVERLDGRITFDSRPGEGTTVTVGLPLAAVRPPDDGSPGPDAS